MSKDALIAELKDTCKVLETTIKATTEKKMELERLIKRLTDSGIDDGEAAEEEEGRLLKRKNIRNKWWTVAMECITCHRNVLSILHRCINILSKVITLILLQANIRSVVLRKHILIFHGRL